MIRNWFGGVLLLFVLTSSIQGQGREALLQSVSSLPGWTASSKPAIFNESTIDEFDAKLAAILRIYGLNGVTVQAWQSPSGELRATLFQLSDAGAAYGFFSNRRRLEGTLRSSFSAGAESFRNGKYAYFWQAAYVVRLEGEARAMQGAAEVMSRNILGRSQRPPISTHLPATNLIAGSEEYILDAASLPKMEGIDSDGIGFDVSAEVAMADYWINGKKVRLLLAIYPTQQLAKKYADQIFAHAPALGSSQKRIGPILAIVSGTTDSFVIQSLLDQVHYSSKVTWNEPQPGLGLGPVIVTVFTFIALLLGACIFAGVGLGGFRILMKSRYPNHAFNRPSDVGIIQLKLDQELTRKEIHE